MKITEVKVIVTCPGRNYVFVKVMTDEPGLYGVGEGTLNGSEPIVAEALRHISHLLIGRDPQRIEDTWHLVYRQGYWRGGPIFMAALAAIDIALWDIKGKQAGLPVYQLLGGKAREGVMVYSHAGGRDPVEAEDSVRALMAKGFKVIRGADRAATAAWASSAQKPPLSPGTPADADLRADAEYRHRAEAVRPPAREARHGGGAVPRRCTSSSTRSRRRGVAKELEPYRLFFLEDPLMPEHRESWPLVRAASTTPLAIGEIFTSRWDCLPLFMNRWIDFIRIKPLHVGGLTEARKIMTLAEPFNVRSAFHGAADIGPVGQAASRRRCSRSSPTSACRSGPASPSRPTRSSPASARCGTAWSTRTRPRPRPGHG